MRQRLVYIALILLAAPLLAGGKALEKIDRGLGHAADTISDRDRITGERAINLISREDQINRSDPDIDQALAKLRQQGIPYNEAIDPNVYAAVKEIFQRVHAVSHMRDEPWKILVIPDPSFNAFVNGGTYVVVHVGLLKGVEDEHEVAAVIGHEIAHVAANHVFEKQSQLAFARITGSKSVKRETFHAAFTHEQEEEADKIGIMYAALAGYDPFAASRLWGRIYKEQGNVRLYVHDHPVNSERAENTFSVAGKVKQYYSPGQKNSQFAELLDDNVLWKKRQQTEEGRKGSGTAAFVEALLQGAIKHKQAKLEEERQEQHIAFVKSVNQYLKPTAVQATGPKSLRVWYQYRANSFRFKRLVLALRVAKADGGILRMVQIYQNSQFVAGDYYADFGDDELDAYRVQQHRNLTLSVDDVEW